MLNYVFRTTQIFSIYVHKSIFAEYIISTYFTPTRNSNTQTFLLIKLELQSFQNDYIHSLQTFMHRSFYNNKLDDFTLDLD